MLTQPNRSCLPALEGPALHAEGGAALLLKPVHTSSGGLVSFTLVCFNLLLLSSWPHGLQSKQAGQVKRAPTRLQGGS